jgi:hypothetical protein
MRVDEIAIEDILKVLEPIRMRYAPPGTHGSKSYRRTKPHDTAATWSSGIRFDWWNVTPSGGWKGPDQTRHGPLSIGRGKAPPVAAKEDRNMGAGAGMKLTAAFA